eukprot:scaffold3158_cov389-Prasinococcus_capsulatus_cf.AAC.7
MLGRLLALGCSLACPPAASSRHSPIPALQQAECGVPLPAGWIHDINGAVSSFGHAGLREACSVVVTHRPAGDDVRAPGEHPTPRAGWAVSLQARMRGVRHAQLGHCKSSCSKRRGDVAVKETHYILE